MYKSLIKMAILTTALFLPALSNADTLIIEIQHDGVNTSSYGVFQDGVEICSGPGNVITCETVIIPGQTYSFTADARNIDGASPQSDPVLWTMPYPMPTVPVVINIRLANL